MTPICSFPKYIFSISQYLSIQSLKKNTHAYELLNFLIFTNIYVIYFPFTIIDVSSDYDPRPGSFSYCTNLRVSHFSSNAKFRALTYFLFREGVAVLELDPIWKKFKILLRTS